MRFRLSAAVAAMSALLALVGARADAPSSPAAAQDRSTEPVVLTGAQFPGWSAGADPVGHEPQAPVNYDAADVEQYLAPPFQSECYHKPSTQGSGYHAN